MVVRTAPTGMKGQTMLAVKIVLGVAVVNLIFLVSEIALNVFGALFG